MKQKRSGITAQFKKQFDLLSKHTPEYEITVPYIVKNIVSKLPRRGNFIDVGTGRGNLAKPLSEHFDHTMIIEPNRLYYREVLDWAAEANRDFSGHNTDWLNADINGTKADMVLMSHVMYYTERSSWLDFIQKAYDILNPGGYIVIILNSIENGVTDLYKEFFPEGVWSHIASSEGVLEFLHNNDFRNVSFSAYQSTIYAETLDEINDLIEFLLLHRVKFDTGAISDRRDTYSNTYLRIGNYYGIQANGHIIHIKKSK